MKVREKRRRDFYRTRRDGEEDEILERQYTRRWWKGMTRDFLLTDWLICVKSLVQVKRNSFFSPDDGPRSTWHKSSLESNSCTLFFHSFLPFAWFLLLLFRILFFLPVLLEGMQWVCSSQNIAIKAEQEICSNNLFRRMHSIQENNNRIERTRRTIIRMTCCSFSFHVLLSILFLQLFSLRIRINWVTTNESTEKQTKMRLNSSRKSRKWIKKNFLILFSCSFSHGM